MIKVYQTTVHGKRFFENPSLDLAHDLQLVGVSNDNLSLNEVYSHCNSTYCNWFEEDGNPIRPTGKFRSLSVGDVINKDGVYFQVYSFGFKQMAKCKYSTMLYTID
jgi:hypothetical protein